MYECVCVCKFICFLLYLFFSFTCLSFWFVLFLWITMLDLVFWNCVLYAFALLPVPSIICSCVCVCMYCVCMYLFKFNMPSEVTSNFWCWLNEFGCRCCCCYRVLFLNILFPVSLVYFMLLHICVISGFWFFPSLVFFFFFFFL